ncbi:DNA replication terminus site-binding protein [Stutzerimonas stutzeri]|uniref:DNA replication terminus site-binding protein n=1 Tax=Stutzerimonas stutzeri TaxID=316 RepID=UPI0015E44AFA|nr:DNA replication terminus site-binding protein [Stutzerimonas stutzeri]MBA1280219.1 DNA replication terminus site-binding protein [Stutzerimonas stutzeri]
MQALINITVSESLHALQEALDTFNEAVRAPSAVVRGLRFNAIDGTEETNPPLTELLFEAVNTWDMTQESENGSVIRFPGVFEVGQDVMEAAQRLNEAKSALSQCVAQLEADGADSRQIRSAYRASQYPNLHPLQAWRQIVLLAGPNIASVGFTVAKMSHSIEVMTHADAMKRLADANAFDVIEQIEGLPANSAIRWHTPVTRHIRANVVWQDEDTRISRMFHASLPFLVPIGDWPSKRVRFNQPRSHAQRNDRKGTIQVHLPLRKGAFLSVS